VVSGNLAGPQRQLRLNRVPKTSVKEHVFVT